MLNVSNAYRLMMLEPVMESRMEITISNGSDSIKLHNKDIVADSLSINWRSTNNNTFSLGTCYATSLNFSAFNSMDTEIEGNYLTITPVVFYKLANNQEEEIPLGVFRCDNPVNYARTTSYECYDFMLALDEKIESRFSGTPYNVLTFLCAKCGVTLGSTSQSISAMANASQTLIIDPQDVRTYRDLLAYIAILLGGYAQFGRDGRLYVKQFHNTSDFELKRKRRTNASFAGYKTVFCGVKCRFLADQNFYPYEYTNDQMLSGVVVDLGDIPVIQDTVAHKWDIIENIYNVIKDLEYYPCSIDMAGDPSFETGDMITTKDREGYLRDILLTSITWSWRKAGNIVSDGANPKNSKVTTTTQKINQKIEESDNKNTVVTTTYVNGNPLTVGSSQAVEITNLKFTTEKDLTAIFGAEIPVHSSGDGYVEISYVDSGIVGDVVKARVTEGYNLITLVNHLYYDANRIVLLQLKAQTEALNSGGTAPTVTIDQNTIRSYIFAQGMSVEAPWDGIISISETFDYVETQLEVYGLTDGVVVTTYTPIDTGLSDVFSAATSELNVYGQSDTVELTLEYGDQILRMGMGHRAGKGRMYARW